LILPDQNLFPLSNFYLPQHFEFAGKKVVSSIQIGLVRVTSLVQLHDGVIDIVEPLFACTIPGTRRTSMFENFIIKSFPCAKFMWIFLIIFKVDVPCWIGVSGFGFGFGHKQNPDFIASLNNCRQKTELRTSLQPLQR
jgi:hypothetical protein